MTLKQNNANPGSTKINPSYVAHIGNGANGITSLSSKPIT